MGRHAGGCTGGCRGRYTRWLSTAWGGLGLQGGLGGVGDNQGGTLRGRMAGGAQDTAGGVEVPWRE